MTNPNNAVGTDGAYGGRTSVNAFNDNLAQYSRGVLNGWDIAAGGGMSVDMGGNGTDRDVAVAEDNAGNKTTINNISASPINVSIATAHATNDRLDVIVAYVDNPPTGNSTDVDNPGVCGIIDVTGIPASTPVAPDDTAIRTAITADGASGATAYYVILYTIKVKAAVTVIDSSAWVFTGNSKPWANVRGNRFIAPGTVTNPLLSQNAVRSSNIDWATFTFLTGSTTSIQLTAGKWLVIATLNVLTAVDSGSFDTTVSWLNKSLLFQGYRVSGQNRNQEAMTFINVLEPSTTTTYAAARSDGDQVNFYQGQWVAIKVSN